MQLTGFPLPPQIAMNLQAQMVMEVVMGVGAVFAIAYLVLEARRHKTLLPVMLFFGILIAPYYEILLDVMALAIYPHEGQHTYVESFGRKLPVYLVLAWVVYFGPAVWIFKKRFDAGVAPAVWWKTYVVLAIACTAFEIPALHYDLWAYYGEQPFVFMKMPLWWGIVNPIAILGPAFAYYKLGPHLNGWRVVIGIPLMGMALTGFHTVAVLPVATTLNMSYGQSVTMLGALGSLIVTMILCWIFFNVTNKQEETS